MEYKHMYDEKNMTFHSLDPMTLIFKLDQDMVKRCICVPKIKLVAIVVQKLLSEQTDFSEIITCPHTRMVS